MLIISIFLYINVMKLKHLAFTFLILMISFAGFSLTTTDLCQDSNHELIVSLDADKEIHGVVDSIVSDDVNISDEEKSFTNHYRLQEATIQNDLYIQNYSLNERRIREPDQRQNLNHTLKRLSASTIDKIAYRKARDGFRRC